MLSKREKNDNTFIAVTDIKVVKDENVQCAYTHMRTHTHTKFIINHNGCFFICILCIETVVMNY